VVRRIYEKYKNDLLAIAAGLLNDVAASEDVVHDVFVSFLKLQRFRLTGSLKGYLATCTANAARNAIRSRARRAGVALDNAESVTAKAAGPDCEAIFGEDCRRLELAMNELPYEQREVLLLHIKGGLKFSQIAESQGVSINTALGRYRYGLDKLRAMLDGEVQK